MCGRLSCIYSKYGIQERCKYQIDRKSARTLKPLTHKFVYKASYNIGPGKMAPVLVHASNILPKAKNNERCLVAMQFGLVRSLPTTNRVINARSETVHEKSMFSSLLNKGQRCVIACNGFYEWKKVKGQSIPYFFYSTRFTNFKKKALDKDFAKDTLTYLAGLYEYRPPKENDDKLGNGYYFVIITSDANSSTKTIHDRLPVTLNSEDDVEKWLNAETYSTTQALKLLKPCKAADLEYYQVSQFVNNVNNDDKECILPFVKREQAGSIDKYLKPALKSEPIEYDKKVKHSNQQFRAMKRKGKSRSISRNNSALTGNRRNSRSASNKRQKRSTSSQQLSASSSPSAFRRSKVFDYKSKNTRPTSTSPLKRKRSRSIQRKRFRGKSPSTFSDPSNRTSSCRKILKPSRDQFKRTRSRTVSPQRKRVYRSKSPIRGLTCKSPTRKQSRSASFVHTKRSNLNRRHSSMSTPITSNIGKSSAILKRNANIPKDVCPKKAKRAMST